MRYIFSVFVCFFMVLYTDNIMADFPIVDNLDIAQSLSESTEQPLILIFGSKSCTFCGLLKKDIENGYFLVQLDGKIVCYIDVAKRQDLIDKYDITSLPDTRFIIDGKQKGSMVGYEKSKYKKWLSNLE